MPGSRTARSWLPAAAAVSAAGWGANQFTPLSSVYRAKVHWPALPLSAMFSAYLLGLVPGLLLGGPAADRRGRRRVVRFALGLSAAASAALALATVTPTAVYISRLGTGIAAGLIFTAGTAWVRELSTDPDRPDAGARRTTYATGGGFAAGALAAGALAEWLPHPMVVPCLAHTILALLVLLATRRVPETAPAPGKGLMHAPTRGLRRSPVQHPRFVRVILPATPAVFLAATVAYVVLPPLVADRVPGYAPLFSGLVAAITLTMGLAVQPLAVRLDHKSSARATLTAMATVIVGLLGGSFAVYWNSAALVMVAAVILGAGYGISLVAGLKEIERLAPPSDRPSAASLYQSTISTGFLTPLLLATTSGFVSDHAQIAVLAAVGLLCFAITAWHSRRHLPSEGADPAIGPPPGPDERHGTTHDDRTLETRSEPWGE